MNKIFPTLCLLSGLALTLLSCNKDNASDDDPIGPDFTVKTSGILCSGNNQYSYNSMYSVVDPIQPYDPQLNEGGRNHMFMTKAGDLEVRFQMKRHDGTTPYIAFLKSIQYSGYFFNTDTYSMQSKTNPDPETVFIIERDPNDINQFSIESSMHRGYFLAPTRENRPAGSYSRLVPAFRKSKAYWHFR